MTKDEIDNIKLEPIEDDNLYKRHINAIKYYKVFCDEDKLKNSLFKITNFYLARTNRELLNNNDLGTPYMAISYNKNYNKGYNIWYDILIVFENDEDLILLIRNLVPMVREKYVLNGLKDFLAKEEYIDMVTALSNAELVIKYGISCMEKAMKLPPNQDKLRIISYMAELELLRRLNQRQ